MGAVPLTAIGRRAGWSQRVCYNYYNDTDAAELPVVEAAAGTSRPYAVWVAPEQARRSLPALVKAVSRGAEVVLTQRGAPVAKLVPAVEEAARLRRMVRVG